tara:strand:+ start:302 stop:496 length:195 start_codon:yes stop_codon:yes gene_type:complete
MSDILIERLKNSIGKRVLIFLHNNFRYEGKVTNCDDTYVEILDDKIKGYKILEISSIRDIEVKE